MPTNTHLYLFRSTYYFRCRIPADLKEVFGGSDDFKRSLRTKSLIQARKLLKTWSYKAECVFTLLRSGMLTERHIDKLLADFKKNCLERKGIGYVAGMPDSKEGVRASGIEGVVGACEGLQGIVEPKVMLSDVVETYITEYQTTGKVGGPTQYELETKCRQFVKVVGDRDIRNITRTTVLDYLKVLKQLPKNMSKNRMYDGKTIEEVLEMQPKDVMSDTTLNNYLVRVNSFFSWAVQVGYIDRNPADGVKHGKTKLVRADELRKAYAPEDLCKLVDGYIGMRDEEKAKLKTCPDRFWIPLISLYSGLRLNEICQLNTEDIKQDEETGVWFFHVEITDGDEKMIKSAAARRKIPLHQDLITLGLLDYRKHLVSLGAPRLWMNLKLASRGYHKNFANWFLGNGSRNGFLRKHVTQDDKLNFHSFRHTFINALKQKKVDEFILAEMAGHSNKSMTFGRYGKPFGLADKQQVVNMLDYGVNLESLRGMAKITLEI